MLRIQDPRSEAKEKTHLASWPEIFSSTKNNMSVFERAELHSPKSPPCAPIPWKRWLRWAQIPGNQHGVWVDLPSFIPYFIFAKFYLISFASPLFFLDRNIMTHRKFLAMPRCPRWELVAFAPLRRVTRKSFIWTVGGGGNGGNSHELWHVYSNRNHYCFWWFYIIS